MGFNPSVQGFALPSSAASLRSDIVRLGLKPITLAGAAHSRPPQRALTLNLNNLPK